MVYILQIYNKCTTFPNQIVITIISGAKFSLRSSLPDGCFQCLVSLGSVGKVNFFGKVGKAGILGKMGNRGICRLAWCVVVGSSPVTTAVVDL